MDEGPTTLNDVAGVVPKSTLVPVPLVNPVPVIVTLVAPLGGPVAGEIPVTVGEYVNWSEVVVAVVPWGLVTVTSTKMPVPAGETAVICVPPEPLTGLNDVAGVVPKSTCVAPENPLPLMVTVVPPV
jgi:hypothetical protein